MGGRAERRPRQARDRAGLSSTRPMPTIRIATSIDATPERCFDLARDVAAHVRSTPGTDEQAGGGVTVGLLELGDEVTWEARHLGIRQRLTVRISRFERPRRLQDRLVP